MKRVVCALLIVILLASLCACVENKQEISKHNEEKTQKEIAVADKVETKHTEENVADKIQGYWMAAQNRCEFLSIKGIEMNSGAYPGGIGRSREIKDVLNRSGNTYTVRLYYPETVEYDEQLPAEEEIIKISSDDNFSYSLIIENESEKISYVYAGKTWEEFVAKSKNENTTTTPAIDPSESNYYKYMDKTVQDIRNEHGQERESWVENCRKVLVYDDPLLPLFYYSFHLGSGENAFKSLQREPVAPSNAFITGFVANLNGTEVYKGIKIGDNFDKATNLLGAITEKRDSLSAISYPGNGGRIDWILDDKGTILYASVTYSS